jgi:ATP-binding cassette subfamily B (MDR/TAP) protein 1
MVGNKYIFFFFCFKLSFYFFLPLVASTGFFTKESKQHLCNLFLGGDIFSTLSPLLLSVMGIAQNGSKIKYFPIAGLALGKIKAFLTDDSGIQNIENTTEVKDVEGSIAMDQVSFAYPSASTKQVLNSVSFTVPAGTTAALVGESGCGKSTMVGLLLRLYDPTSGRILLDGVDINTYTLQSYRKHIGLVSQEPVLFATTIGENIGFGKEGSSMEDVISAAKSAQIHDFIVSLPDGYDTLVGEKGTQLSGGQKQRVAIARAFLKAPKVFVLDEATSALDTQSERAIQDALIHLTAGCTTISIAHRLSTIKDCNLIVGTGGLLSFDIFFFLFLTRFLSSSFRFDF